MVVVKEIEVLAIGERRQRVHRGAHVEQPAPFRLLFPLFRVAISVEDDALELRDLFAEKRAQCVVEARAPLGGRRKLIRHLAHGLRNDRVEHHARRRHTLRGAQSPELELVARERKGRSPISVTEVLRERGQALRAQAQQSSVRHARRGSRTFDLLQNVRELISQEHGDDGGRRLVRAQPMVVSRVGN